MRTPSREYRSRTQTAEDCDDRTDFMFTLGKRPWGLITLSDLSRDLIGQFLGFKKEDSALKLDPALDLTWTTTSAYKHAANASVREQEEILESVESGLKARGLVSRQEAEIARPQIELRILDQCTEKIPLPDLVFGNPSIDVTYQAIDLESAN